MSKTIGYIRVSTDKQNTENQKLAILEHCNREKLSIDNWIETTASSRKSSKDRKIDQLLQELEPGDMIMVAELSRLGRSVGQIAILVNDLVANDIRVTCIKESIRLNGSPDIQTKVMITMFSLFAEIERDLISERTKEGLQRARAAGKLIGRPTGPGSSKLDQHLPQIKEHLALGVKKKRIAELCSTTPANLRHYLKKRNITG